MSQSSRLLDKEVAEQLGLDVIPGDEWDDVDWWEITPEGRRVLRPYSTSLDVAWTLPLPEGYECEVFGIGNTAAVRMPVSVSSRRSESNPDYVTCPNTPGDIATAICRLWLALRGRTNIMWAGGNLVGTLFGIPLVETKMPYDPNGGAILRVITTEEADQDAILKYKNLRAAVVLNQDQYNEYAAIIARLLRRGWRLTADESDWVKRDPTA